jgi:hypothetical protein
MRRFKRYLIVALGTCVAVPLALAPPPSHAQGNDTVTSSITPGAVKSGVLIGAGTSDETTTGSSGPQQVSERQTPPAGGMGSANPGSNGFFCADIRDETARNACDAKKRNQP